MPAWHCVAGLGAAFASRGRATHLGPFPAHSCSPRAHRRRTRGAACPTRRRVRGCRGCLYGFGGLYFSLHSLHRVRSQALRARRSKRVADVLRSQHMARRGGDRFSAGVFVCRAEEHHVAGHCGRLDGRQLPSRGRAISPIMMMSGSSVARKERAPSRTCLKRHLRSSPRLAQAGRVDSTGSSPSRILIGLLR